MPYALVTGASKGIGKAIAEELAQRNCNLLLIARSESLLQQMAKDLTDKFSVQVNYLAIDLAIPSASEQIKNWLSENKYDINILVNNAGYGLSGAFENNTANDYRDMMQVNMNVPITLTHLLLPALKKQPKSHILNIVSSAAYQAVPGLTVYAASKSFMLSFSRGLQYELRNSTVAVTAVSPGGTSTDFANRANLGEKAVKAGEKLNMTPAEVARLAVDAMFARKTETITGFINKLGAALVWLLPKKLAEKTAAGIYNID